MGFGLQCLHSFKPKIISSPANSQEVRCCRGILKCTFIASLESSAYMSWVEAYLWTNIKIMQIFFFNWIIIRIFPLFAPLPTCLLNFSSRNHCVLINHLLMPLVRTKDGKGMNIFQKQALRKFQHSCLDLYHMKLYILLEVMLHCVHTMLDAEWKRLQEDQRKAKLC